MDEYEQCDVVVATYLPQKMTDLKPWAAAWIGTRARWTAMWVVDDGAYAGQWAFAPRTNLDERRSGLPPFGWAPLCDLADVVRERGVSRLPR